MRGAVILAGRSVGVWRRITPRRHGPTRSVLRTRRRPAARTSSPGETGLTIATPRAARRQPIVPAPPELAASSALPVHSRSGRGYCGGDPRRGRGCTGRAALLHRRPCAPEAALVGWYALFGRRHLSVIGDYADSCACSADRLDRDGQPHRPVPLRGKRNEPASPARRGTSILTNRDWSRRHHGERLPFMGCRSPGARAVR